MQLCVLNSRYTRNTSLPTSVNGHFVRLQVQNVFLFSFSKNSQKASHIMTSLFIPLSPKHFDAKKILKFKEREIKHFYVASTFGFYISI